MDNIVLLLLWVALLSLICGLGAAVADRMESRRLRKELERDRPAFLRRQAD